MWRTLAVVVYLLLPAAAARADIAPSPPWELRDPANWSILFTCILLAVVARMLLLGLRAAVRRVHSRVGAPQPAPRRSSAGSVATIVMLTVLFYAGVHVMQQLGRQQYVRQRQRRYEPKSNLGAIRSTEVAYFAEWNVWVGNQPLTPRRGSKERDRRLPWDATTRFSILGFAPEGDVGCSYALSGPDWPAGPEGFTATAECDLDEDRGVAVYTITAASNEITQSWRARK